MPRTSVASKQRGEVRVFSGVPAEADEIVRRAGGAEVVVTGWARFDEKVLSRLPDLRLLSIGSTGVDMIDVPAATARSVAICHVPSYATNAVAELTLGLMLAVFRKIPGGRPRVRATGRLDWQAFGGRRAARQDARRRRHRRDRPARGSTRSLSRHEACWAATSRRQRRWSASWE